MCRKREKDTSTRRFLRRFQPKHSVIIHVEQEVSGGGHHNADTDNNGETDDEAAEETEKGKLEEEKRMH